MPNLNIRSTLPFVAGAAILMVTYVAVIAGAGVVMHGRPVLHLPVWIGQLALLVSTGAGTYTAVRLGNQQSPWPSAVFLVWPVLYTVLQATDGTTAGGGLWERFGGIATGVVGWAAGASLARRGLRLSSQMPRAVHQ